MRKRWGLSGHPLVSGSNKDDNNVGGVEVWNNEVWTNEK